MLSNAPVSANVAVSDLKRAMNFYNKSLGLTVQTGPTPGEAMCSCGDGTTLHMYEAEGFAPSPNTCATFRVDNIQQEMAGLRKNGVQFEDYDIPGGTKTHGGLATMGALKAAWFKDPDGNLLCIHQEK